tara:strand:+ start:188 stop:502 length:315 start_codon:yes stop_codon:yes gene_type:complete
MLNKYIIFFLLILISAVIFSNFIRSNLSTEIIIKTSNLNHKETMLLSSDFDDNSSIIFYNIDDRTNSIHLKYNFELSEDYIEKIKYLLSKWNIEIFKIEMINFY